MKARRCTAAAGTAAQVARGMPRAQWAGPGRRLGGMAGTRGPVALLLLACWAVVEASGVAAVSTGGDGATHSAPAASAAAAAPAQPNSSAVSTTYHMAAAEEVVAAAAAAVAGAAAHTAAGAAARSTPGPPASLGETLLDPTWLRDPTQADWDGLLADAKGWTPPVGAEGAGGPAATVPSTTTPKPATEYPTTVATFAWGEHEGAGGVSVVEGAAAANTSAPSPVLPPASPDHDPFYTPPSPLPSNATPGTILKWRRQGLTLDPVGRVPVPGVDAFTVMFVSTTARGAPVALVAAVFVPRTPWVGGDGGGGGDGRASSTPTPRPLVAFSDATRGLGDKCASTWMYATGMDAEGPWVMALLDRGWGVVVFDRQASERGCGREEGRRWAGGGAAVGGKRGGGGREEGGSGNGAWDCRGREVGRRWAG